MKLATPVFSVLCFFSFVCSSGLSVTLPRELTQNGVERANTVFQSVFSVIVAIGVCITTAGVLYPAILTDLFTGASCAPQVRSQTADYLRPILIGALPILLYDILSTIWNFASSSPTTH